VSRTSLPLLLTLTYRAYWYSNYGDYIQETPIYRIRRFTGPTWGIR